MAVPRPSRRQASLATAAGVAAVAGAALWWRRHPSACPYGQRLWVMLPRPIITARRLVEVLAPAPGERLLEVGAGTGYYAVPVARALGPDGTLAALDLQQPMLDHLLQRAARHGLANVEPRQGDAQALPYADASFDGAYLVTVLGEVRDRGAALRELHRVVRPGGRVVSGELVGDPHAVRFAVLQREAEAAGLRLERRLGGPLGYLARFGLGGAAR